MPEKRVNVISPSGQLVSLPESQVQSALTEGGYRLPGGPGASTPATQAASILKPLLQAAPETTGALIGEQLGTVGGIPGRIAGAGIGGAGGRAAGLFFGLEAPPPTMGEFARRIGRAGVEQAAISGAFGGAGALYRAIRGAKTIEPGVAVALKRGIPLRTGQATQNSFLSAIENVTERAIGASGPFIRLGRKQNAALREMGEGLLNQISSGRLTRSESGQLVAETMLAVERGAGKAYAEAEAALATKMGGKPLGLSKDITGLLNDSLKQAAGLEGVAPGAKQAVEEIIEVLMKPQSLSYETAFLAGKRMRLLADKLPFGSVRNAVSKSRRELLNHIADSASQAGGGAEVKTYKETLSRFAEVKQGLDHTFLNKLVRDRRGKEALGAALASRSGGLELAESIKKVYGGSIPDEVRQVFVEEILRRAVTEDVITADALEAVIKGVGSDTITGILKPQEARVLLNEILPVANLLSLPKTLTRPPSSQPTSLLAMGQSGLVTGALMGAGAYAGGLQGALAGIFTPLILSRILTSETGRKALTLALTSKVPGEAIKGLTRLSIATQDQIKKEQESRSIRPIPRNVP